ncbi:C6 finger domain protein, putative [Cordyceps militaris CM01]|uniref:C6 finger domain protein, putative n=1 Tax=Cordyceps militaris (strain CM01) TaxID=983644 RepID=G3JJV8_CORMM|nr:C6 finger domain protein, putative [Cordyceps militaris CM01]EGX92142.1 C6 finger domain protein, putative [Cordyceps militaris CM01]
MPRAKNQGSSEPKRRSRTGCCNEFLVDTSATDHIGVPLQRYATAPNPAHAGPIHYEFEHTLFQDLHQGSSDMSASSAVVVKRKAKSMDDAFSMDRRTSADLGFNLGAGQDTTMTNTAAHVNGVAQSPASTISTSEEVVLASRSARNDAPRDPYYLDQAPSPIDLGWNGTWTTSTDAMMGCIASHSPQLSRVASCTSDEMALASIWGDSAAVETSDCRSSVDGTGTDCVDCPTSLSYMAQVGYSSAPTCSMMCLMSRDPWMMVMGDMNQPLTGTRALETVPEQATPTNGNPPWIISSEYQQTINALPKGISPIPDKLRDETNMMFFDHFVNYTAKAVHRSQVLRMTEPELRIAEWAEDIFSVLRVMLGDQTQAVTDDTLLSMVLLTSLEKSSPSTFGANIPWQKHINLTRSLMEKRLATLNAQNAKSDELSFIFSWFSYLDTMGQVSNAPLIEGISPQTGPYDLLHKISVDDEEEFDCVMGFTTHCGQLLVELSAQIRQLPPDDDEQAAAPDEGAIQAALDLERRFKESMTKPVKVCHHLRKNKMDMRSLTEMDAASQAFHWAGVVYLRRRILRKTSGDDGVQDGVQRIWECIQHVKRARKLMEASWRGGQPWYNLIQDEYLG